MASLFVFSSLACTHAGEGAYNVLYFVADDLRPEIAGAYGQTQAITPNIDKLAATGMTFRRAYCQQAVCGPSRNSFMTGRRPHHTNVLLTGTGQDFRISGLDVNGPGFKWVSLPEHFKRSNWTTLGGGKTFHPNAPKNFDYPTSWDDWGGHPHGFTGNYYDYAYWLNNATTKVGYPGPCPGVAKPDPDAEAGLSGPIAVWCGLDEPDEHFYDHGLANDTIYRLRFAAAKRAKDGSAFFVQSGFARPHTPWRVPQRFWDLYDTDSIVLATHKLPPPDMPGVAWMAHSFFNSSTGAVWSLNVTTPLPDHVAQLARHAYFASVSWLDHQIGRILDELDELDIADQTIVVLHGDHGWQLGEHNSWHKYTNFELGTRVPLIIRAPSMPASHGVIAEGLAELVDVYPTLAELAGTPVPTDHLDGVSLKGFFEDPSRTTLSTRSEQGTRNKTLAFSQYPHASVPICPALSCPVYRDGRCHPAPASASTAEEDFARVDWFNNNTWMGFSVRNASWRYTAWVPYNGTRAQWGARPPLLVEELYDHTADVGTDFDAMDTANLAYSPAHTQTAAHFFAVARDFFEDIAPPTSSTGSGPAPHGGGGCESFCKTKSNPWPAKCTWVHCVDCPQCK